MINIGDKLKHPVKGIGVVRAIENPATNQWGMIIPGYFLIVEFKDWPDKQYRIDNFHSKYLDKLEIVK